MLEPGLRGVQRSRLSLGGKSGPRGHETAPSVGDWLVRRTLAGRKTTSRVVGSQRSIVTRKMPRLAQLCAALLLGICMESECAEPAQPELTITAGADTKHFTAAELLSRADLASLEIPPNIDYKVSLKAVPLLDLLAAIPLEGLNRLRPAPPMVLSRKFPSR